MANSQFVLAIKADPSSAVRELQKLGEAGQAALKRLADATNPANSGLLAVNTINSELSGRIDDLAGRAGIAGRVLSGFGPVGIAAAAGIGGLTAAFISGTRELAKYEEAVGRLQSVLTATGNSTGLTIGQIKTFADELEKSTGATEEQVLQATAALATFGSVSGDNLKRVIRLGQDLSATFGGDLVSNAQALAAAISNPAEGLWRLDKNIKAVLGSNFQLIGNLLKTGKTAEGTALLIETLEKKLGGAGDSRGLVGATDQLGKSWEDLLKTIGNTSIWIGTLEVLKNFFDTTRKSISLTLDENIERIEKINKLNQTSIIPLFNITDFGAGLGTESQRNKKLLELRTLKKSIEEKDNLEAQNSQSLADANQEYDKRLKTLNATLEENIKRQNDQYTANKKIADGAQTQISNLKEQISLNDLKIKGDEKGLFIQQQLNRLPAGTGRQQITQARDLAEQIYNQNQAIEGKKEALEKTAEDQKKLAAQAEELWNLPILKAAEDIQDAFSDAFVNIFDGGVKSFSDLSKEIKNIFTKTIAELLSANLVRPIAAGLLSPLLSTGRAQAATGGGGGVGMLSNLSSLSSLIRGGGFTTSIINGLGLSGLTGSLGLTSTGYFAGANAGATYAAGLTGFGSIALPVAGIGLGLLASGLLGNKKPSNKSAGAFIDPNNGSLFQNLAGTLPGVATPKGTENLDRFNQVAAQINTALGSIRELTGGTFNGGLFNVALGSRDQGFTVFNGQKTNYANDRELILGAVRGALKGLTGVSPEISGIIANSGGKSLQDLLTAIGLPKQRSDFNQSVSDEIFRISDPQGYALQQLDKEKQDRIKQAQEIGADITEIEKLYGLRRKEITKDNTESLINLQRGLTDTLLGSNSALSLQEKLKLSDSQLNSTFQAALGGDATARSNFGSVLDQFLALSKEFNATGPGFQNDFARGVGLYQQLLGSNAVDINSLGSSKIVDAIDAQTAISKDNAKSISDTITLLAKQIADLTARLARLDTRPAGT